MKVAIISDVHGNYPALASVVDDAVSNNVEKFIFAGDYIFDLPFSNEVAKLLMNLDNAYIVKGNKEIRLNGLANDNQDNWTLNQFGNVYQTFRELSPYVYDFLNGLNNECYIRVNPDVSIYVNHFPEYIPRLSPVRELFSSSGFLKRMLEKPFSHEQFLEDFRDAVNRDEIKNQIEQIDANIIVFGHNHLQAYCYCGDKLIINPGSCGLPLDFNTAAPYTILEITDCGFDVTEKRVEYDVESVINESKKSLLYEKSVIYSEIVYLSLKEGREYIAILFEIARQIAASKNEQGAAGFSNSTWDEAYEVFKSRKI
ncbi:MAG: metallophosphoesterase family protein [Oscillospiraceae bacterium]|nr:metallophosphoesterase family protein [Oscillospiraceae bacterium]